MEKCVCFGMREEMIKCSIDINYDNFMTNIKEAFEFKEDTFLVENLTENNFSDMLATEDSFKIIRSEKNYALEILEDKKCFVRINTPREVDAFLLLYGFKIDKDGWSPLHWSVSRGNVEIVKFLLEKNFENIHQGDKNDRTPLHWAVLNNRKEIVKILLGGNFTNANNPDEDGVTPLNLAVFNRNTEIVKLLLEKNFDNAHQKDKKDKSPLSWAIINGNAEIVKLLRDDIKRRKQ